MKRLNNKGITTVEVLICFVLIVIITVSIYATVSNFNERKTLEGYKERIFNFTNLLTKEIQDDLIKVGLTHAEYETRNIYYDINGDEIDPATITDQEQIETTKSIYTVTCELKDGTKRQLVIEKLLAASSFHVSGSKVKDDEFSIKYGKYPDDLIEWDLPDVGHSGYDGFENKICEVDIPNRPAHCRKVQDFSINNVLINISDDNVLSIYIGFYHPDFGTRYAINIVSPINYVPTGYDSLSSWNY